MTSDKSETLTISVSSKDDDKARKPSRRRASTKSKSEAAIEEDLPEVKSVHQDNSDKRPIPERMNETVTTVLKAYDDWKNKPSDDTIGDLHDSVQEVRRVLAAIEIEQLTDHSRRHQKPIPIPQHRSHSGKD